MSCTLALPPDVSPKRASILMAGAQLFMASGYANVSMDAVAKEAGVSKATLYAYFSGKEALFAAIVEGRCSAIAAESEELASHAASTDAALRELGRVWIRFLMSPQSLAIHRTVIAECARFPDLARAFYASGPARGRGWLARRLEDAQRWGKLREDADPQVAADHLMGLIRGDLYMQAMLGGPVPDEAAMDAVVDAAVAVFLRAYGVPPPG
ncbi:TetR/AcrR family transcriptional regulator [Pararoseomonas sp. SCSIO 73927]|uniref:TetR/AcrR family transcriptional regulator n=1 Tax=Pararoseomonas sp. SCSIO 73927 TaxID=3114537 RepID=UPI0030CB3701